MSNINFEAHNVDVYVVGKSAPLNGQRLAKVTYKTDKETGVKKESKCVSVPPVAPADITDNIAVLIPAIIGFVQDTQDKIIRELVDSGSVLISGENISMTAVAEYLENSGESGRLTKESIGAWFDSSVVDSLTVALADKMGVSDTPTESDTKKLEAMVGAYKEKISALAGGKTSYPVDIATKLVRALEVANVSDDPLGAKFIARLNKMTTVEQDLLAAL